MRYAIIGTAGRDKTKPMTLKTWNWMLDTAWEIIPQGSHLVSGGAAWADHVAVQLFLEGYADLLTLHLPAPLTNTKQFAGGYGTSGGAANYYHGMFSNTIRQNTIEQIHECGYMPNCVGTVQPVANGFGAMFTRNKLVVSELNPELDHMLAFTFGTNGVAEGGTKHTWDLFRSTNKHHVTIPY